MAASPTRRTKASQLWPHAAHTHRLTFARRCCSERLRRTGDTSASSTDADRTQLQQLLGEWRNDIVRELLEVSR